MTGRHTIARTDRFVHPFPREPRRPPVGERFNFIRRRRSIVSLQTVADSPANTHADPAGFLARHPALPPAVALAAGVFLHDLLPANTAAWMIVLFTSIALAILLHRKPSAATLLIVLGFAAAGGSLARLDHFHFPRNDIAHFSADNPRLARVRFELDHEPRWRVLTFGDRLPLPARQATVARVLAIETWNGWEQTTGRALVQLTEPHAGLRAGQIIESICLLEQPGPAVNPGQFDWQQYYRRQRIVASINIRKATAIRIVAEHAPPPITRWREGARKLLAAGFDPQDTLDHALVQALVLGDYDPELRDVAEQFRKTGTSHHLAISGMHIAVAGGAVFLLARLLRRSPKWCWALATAAVILYGMTAAPNPPVWRAVLLFASAAAAFWLGRGSSAIQLLSIATAALLVINPLDLFSPGFQLSFGTVLGLLVLSQPLIRRFDMNRIPTLPEERERMPWPQRIGRTLDDRALALVAAGIVAWLVSMPLVASHFSRLNTWQVFGSIALAPSVTLTLLAGLLKIVLTLLLPSGAPIFADVVALSSSSMRWIVDELCSLPWSDIPLPSPPWWLMILCWASLVFWCMPLRSGSARLASIGALLLAFGMMLLGPFARPDAVVRDSSSLRVLVMSVGAGQCVLIEPPAGRVCLVDAGSSTVTDLTRNVIVPVLRDRGHTSIDTIFVSHANTDHFSSVAEIASSYGVREILVGPAFERHASRIDPGQAMLRAARLAGAPPRAVRRGDVVPIGPQTSIEILWPDNADIDEPNDASTVMRLTHAGRSILFTGDITEDSLRTLARRDIRADVLIAPHHGSIEDSTDAFIAAVDPMLILASNDRRLSQKQLNFNTLVAGRTLMRTHEFGAIEVVIHEDGTLGVSSFVNQ